MTSRRVGRVLPLLLALVPAVLAAQSVPTTPRQLTLSQALELARRNSPIYRQTLNDADPAAAAVRSAEWARYPTISGSSGLSYTGSGQSAFNGTVFSQASPTVSSNYRLSASWDLSARNFLGASQSRAQQRATEENITGAGVSLTQTVTSQYLAVLRASETVGVARQQVLRNQDFLDIARARNQVGQATILDVRQAEVAKGRADVQLLRALQNETDAKIELFRLMGVQTGDGLDSLVLSPAFSLTEVRFDIGELRRLAAEHNPSLRALDAQSDAAHIGVKSAKSEYLPSLSISTGLSGYTQQFTDVNALLSNRLSGAQGSAANCQFQNGILQRLTSPHPAPNGGIIADCNAYAGLDATGAALQPNVAQAIRSNNSVFPFSFTRQPMSISASISLPIWDGFSRATRVSQARATEDDARESLRAQALAVDGQLQSRLNAVRTSWLAAGIQDTNRTAAREQLRLAQEKYRIGNGSALEVSDAQNVVTQAEADYVTAVYDYHLAVVGLEAVVGRPLR
ncbi:MAG: TolC family protein [Gemmatimonadota bacterium]